MENNFQFPISVGFKTIISHPSILVKQLFNELIVTIKTDNIEVGFFQEPPLIITLKNKITEIKKIRKIGLPYNGYKYGFKIIYEDGKCINLWAPLIFPQPLNFKNWLLTSKTNLYLESYQKLKNKLTELGYEVKE